MKRKFILLTVLMMTFALLCSSLSAAAHSGRTDSSGGHKDNKNKSGLGSYHYHCGGNPAHLHTNGICPYSSITVKPQPPAAKPQPPAVKPQPPAVKPQTNVSVFVNGEPVQFDAPPIIIKDRVMIPMRTTLEKMGVTVLWDQETLTSVGITKQSSICFYDNGLLVGDKPSGYQMFISGELQAADVAPQNINNRLFVPISALVKAFGAEVNWDAVSQTVTITSNIPVSYKLSESEIAIIQSFTRTKATEILYQNGYVPSTDEVNFVYMNGQKYWRFIVLSQASTKEQILIASDGSILELPLPK